MMREIFGKFFYMSCNEKIILAATTDLGTGFHQLP